MTECSFLGGVSL